MTTTAMLSLLIGQVSVPSSGKRWSSRDLPSRRSHFFRSVAPDVPRTAHGGWSVVGAGAGQYSNLATSFSIFNPIESYSYI